MVPVDDTALAVTDTGGTGTPVVYLNGAYASQKDWRRVIAELGTGWRHITYDERARGRSRRSADYSFEACIRDVDAVLEARGVDRPLLVGWSYGAAVALHWGVRNSDRVVGEVAVDGAYPYGLTGEAARAEIRRLFHRMRWILPLARLAGKAARMTAEQHADVNIELNEITNSGDPVFDKVTFPIRFVVASGGNTGADQEDMERTRAALDPVLARNPHVQVSATVASNHATIVHKEFGAIAAAVREIAAARDRGPR
ncbi:alpha/beta hydrolase [Streptosporangiaceae bacterium NEAU-GS5]|nr:alpha/beta hydrolase [Streptosporangiaceae bacterium NEAU-GS5]